MHMFSKRSNYKVIEDGDQLSDSLKEFPRTSDMKQTEVDFLPNDPPNSHEVINASSAEEAFKSGTETSSSYNEMRRSQRWDHIKDVDHFFALIYNYHRGNGFLCIAFKHIYSLLQFIFVIVFSTFLLQCVDYGVLFNNLSLNATMGRKRYISDIIIKQCASQLNPIILFAIFLAILFFIVHFLRVAFYLIRLVEIRAFFTDELKIKDSELQNICWPEIVDRLCCAQKRLNIIVNRDQINALDVYQRILRHQNYFTAMIYHGIIQPKIKLPFIGSIYYLPKGLRFNLDWLLFSGPLSPWKNNYALKDEFKNPTKLKTLADKMSKTITLLSLVNLIFSPLILMYQIMFSFFSYSDMLKREPNVLGMRKYSSYGREKLRHYNEVEHELNTRLNRSYKFASRYMEQFVSPLVELNAKFLAFIAAAFFTVLFVFSAWDEDVLNIEHVLTVMTVSGAIVMICRTFISNENTVFCHQFLMQQIISNIHYAPRTWTMNSHSTDVYAEFSQLFQLKAHYLIEELLSPLLTPFILYFHVRHRCSEIIMFLHKNTVNIEGLGDICSFAQMDISRDGDPRFASLNHSTFVAITKPGKSTVVSGKTELSLLNFSKQNPKWTPSSDGALFIRNLQKIIDDSQLNMSSTLVEAGGVLFPMQKSVSATIPPASLLMDNVIQTSYDRSMQMSIAAITLNNILLTRSTSDTQQNRAKFEFDSQNLAFPMMPLPSMDPEHSNNLLNNDQPLTSLLRSNIQSEHYGAISRAPNNLSYVDSVCTSNLWGVPENIELSRLHGIERSIIEENDEE